MLVKIVGKERILELEEAIGNRLIELGVAVALQGLGTGRTINDDIMEYETATLEKREKTVMPKAEKR